jgi:hypothetical protein
MSLNWNTYENDPCYICGRKLGNKTPQVAYLEDDDQGAVFVGSECINKVVRAGATGLRGGKGKGPRVFASPQMAREAVA